MCNLEVFKPKDITEMYSHWLFTLTTLENSTKLSDKSMGFYQDYDHYNNVRYTRWPCAWPTQVSQYLEILQAPTQISPRTPGNASWLGLGQNLFPADSVHPNLSVPPNTPLTATGIPLLSPKTQDSCQTGLLVVTVCR